MTGRPPDDRSPGLAPPRGWGRLLSASVLLFAGTALAGHPLVSEDAATQGKGNAEVEFGCERTSGGGTRDTSLGTKFTLGLSRRIDLGVGFLYVFREPGGGANSVRGMGDTEVTLKASLGDGGGWIPTMGILAGAQLPTGEETKGLGTGRANGLAAVIADWDFGDVLVHANTGITAAGRPIGSRDRDDRVSASLAAEWEVREGYFLLGEYLWEKNIGTSGSPSSELLAGGKAALSRNLTVDVGIRWGTTGASPDVTYLAGVTLAFQGGDEE